MSPCTSGPRWHWKLDSSIEQYNSVDWVLPSQPRKQNIVCSHTLPKICFAHPIFRYIISLSISHSLSFSHSTTPPKLKAYSSGVTSSGFGGPYRITKNQIWAGFVQGKQPTLSKTIPPDPNKCIIFALLEVHSSEIL